MSGPDYRAYLPSGLTFQVGTGAISVDLTTNRTYLNSRILSHIFLAPSLVECIQHATDKHPVAAAESGTVERSLFESEKWKEES